MTYRPARPRLADLVMFVAILPLLALTLPIILPIALVLKLLGRDKLDASPEYVAGYVRSFIDGTEGGWDWDDFCSIPLKDERLDAIREAVCDFGPPTPIDEQARAELKLLLAEVEAL